MLVSLDIETKRADHITKEGARDYDALIPHKAQITVIGLYAEDGTSKVFRGPNKVEDAMHHLSTIKDLELTGQNFKFDIKHLVYHGADAEFLIRHWKHDSQLLGYVNPNKINQAWLDNYEEQRIALNKTLPRGVSHRAASLHSLKTMAPYFLDVEPFWEDPSDHNNDGYVIKDCKYTLELTQYFLENLHPSDLAFYNNHQLPWTKELLRAELKGVALDFNTMDELEHECLGRRAQANSDLQREWGKAFKVYADEQFELERERIEAMRQRALLRAKDLAKCHKTHDEKITQIKVKPFNLDSSTQLKWLLRDYLQLDITNDVGKESTDKEVLERLAIGNEGVRALLEYRAASKLITTYYPSYKEFAVNGRIHATFNPTGTKTGRLSSQNPNLQNQPAETRAVFSPDPGYYFITKDLSYIEPRLMAYYSEDDELCKIIFEGQDFHGATAQAMFGYIDCDNKEVKKLFPKERGISKTCGLAVMYGAGKNRVKQTMHKAGFTDYTDYQCEAIVKNLRNKFKGVWQFKKELDRTLDSGDTISNLFGRPIKFANKEDIYMQGFNRLIQGSASDIVLESIWKYNDYMRASGIASQALIAVHDEIVVQAPEDKIELCEKVLASVMTNYVLETKYGNIPLITEGEVGLKWKK